MKYRIEYETVTEVEKMIGIEDTYAISVTDLKNILKNAKHPIKKITKCYTDGRGIDVTEKYVKSFDLCEIVYK